MLGTSKILRRESSKTQHDMGLTRHWSLQVMQTDAGPLLALPRRKAEPPPWRDRRIGNDGGVLGSRQPPFP
jgi:hypothetical protein